MAPRRTAILVFVALLFAGIDASIGKAQETPAPVKAVELIGLMGVKQNARGTLKVENGNLQFVHGKTNAGITAASNQDVVTLEFPAMQCTSITYAVDEALTNIVRSISRRPALLREGERHCADFSQAP